MTKEEWFNDTVIRMGVFVARRNDEEDTVVYGNMDAWQWDALFRLWLGKDGEQWNQPRGNPQKLDI